jgi:hypothetical protein
MGNTLESYILLAKELFGIQDSLLKRQLEHPVQLPAVISPTFEADIKKLEEKTQFAVNTGKGSTAKTDIAAGGNIYRLQEARLMVIRRAKEEFLRRKRGGQLPA